MCIWVHPVGAPFFYIRMGRSYAYECPKCGYQTRVSGGPDRGILAWVQTISCRDCKKLYDAVIRLKSPDTVGTDSAATANSGAAKSRLIPTPPPSFQTVLARLRPIGLKRYRWVSYKLQCPVSPIHRVQAWNEPGHCPKCGTFLEKGALPFKLWE